MSENTLTPPEAFEAFVQERRGRFEAADEDEYDALLEANDAYVGHLQYQGNSVSWTKSKADKYGRELLEAWDALRSIGIQPDGETSVAEAIRRYAIKRTHPA